MFKMTEVVLHNALCWGLVGVGALTIVILSFVTAPYGRHYRGYGWGPKIASRVGWIIMEGPALVVFIFVFSNGRNFDQVVPLLLLIIWAIHYINRSLIFPFRMRSTTKSIPLLIVILGFIFNVLNSYLNARWISHFGYYSAEWLSRPLFVIGIFVFIVGFFVNVHSDSILIRLRRPGEKNYKIPYGGAYRWVSSPNYLGELLEWAGWALATWSFSGLAFFVFSAANLVPRAISNHRWCKQTFPSYPPNRKSLIPYVF